MFITTPEASPLDPAAISRERFVIRITPQNRYDVIDTLGIQELYRGQFYAAKYHKQAMEAWCRGDMDGVSKFEGYKAAVEYRERGGF